MSVDHYENFPVASVLLPARLRIPVAMIYRFARAADDFADEGERPDHERLALIAEFDDDLRAIAAGATPRRALLRELTSIIKEHRLPLGEFHDLLSAFSQDVTKKRYANFAELGDYCRRSANPVGRLLLVLYGASTPQHIGWSDNICTSLQLINFLQDIAIDYAKGRIYLPLDELARFGLGEKQIAAQDAGGAWREFMKFEIERTRALLWSGAPLGRALAGRIGLEMRMIIHGGDRILAKIAAVNGDVFRHRPLLRAWDWMLMLVRAAPVPRAQRAARAY